MPTLAQGLVLYWNMHTLLGPAMRDLSGPGNHGTITGTTSAVGKSGLCREFDAAGDIVEAPDSPSLSITGAFSIAAWWRTTVTFPAVAQVINIADKFSSGFGGYKFDVQRFGGTSSCNLLLRVSDGVTGDSAWSSDLFVGLQNVWHHVAVTYDGVSQPRFYRNGALFTTPAPITRSVGDSAVTLQAGGKRNEAAVIAADSQIDELYVWNRLLSTQEILDHMNTLVVWYDGNPRFPKFAAVVERRHQWEAGWTTIPTYLSGSLSRRFDSARALTLVVPNPHGKATDDWKVGDRVRAWAGWDRTDLHPLFEGIVPPGRGLGIGGGMPPTLRVSAVDALGLMALETIAIKPGIAKAAGGDERTYDGWEAATAIRDVLATSKAAPLLGDLGAIEGTNPIRRVGFEIPEPTGVMTRKAYVDAIRAALTDDETAPDAPLDYHYWATANAGGAAAVYLQKARNPATATAIRTIDYKVDLIAAAAENRTSQATTATVSSSTDATLVTRYEDDEAAIRYRRLEEAGTLPSANTDDLLARARRIVNAKRYPVRSYVATVRDGLRHELNQVVRLKNPKYGGTANYLVTGIDIAFAPTRVETQLRLSATEELLTEALA